VKRTVFSPYAPAPVGPYRQAVAIGSMVFCSGQIALDPATGKLAGDDLETQAHQAFANLGEVLRSAGLTFADVVKTTLFLVDMSDFARVNAIYAQYFGQSAPARSTVAVAALPLGAKIEIEAIAVRDVSP
jgi:2-iminobutanoate/2-iminopropanoate deaminase